ncbi:MAG: hypothetical protein MR536_03085 [Prevotella sp.]|nr:hypothetical protein [Prevotella sp.]MDD7461118.1 hypothetical protein [Prevotellaceae bacterium]MDY3364976.1 hypothetical protein [Prevotella sp.]
MNGSCPAFVVYKQQTFMACFSFMSSLFADFYPLYKRSDNFRSFKINTLVCIIMKQSK